ncbi:MAG: tripartite tricarboxylate transporter substrate binding protein [Bradyrhizobiaceae bacterium]|nr:tripartite tricarboxylate transporter substrate binding protein [Bradyrhizobiaceae bacterium]
MLPSRCIAAIFLLAVFAAASAGAQEPYPTHPVRVVVPAPGGSTTDTLARIVADALSQTWGQPAVVENIGGGMVVGAAQVYRSAPDAYTLLVSPPAPIALNQLLYRDLHYDPQQFVPVALLAKVANAMVVRRDLPAANVKELIAYAKANPDKLSYGSQGVGSTAHLSASQFEQMAGIKMVHVPYRGAVAALTDVIAGRMDMFFDTLATSVPMYRADKVKILGVGSPERSPVIPEVPTIEEQGLPGFRSVTWFAVVAPPQTPQALAEKINHDIVDVLRRPDVADKLGKLSLEPLIGSRSDAASFFAEEAQLWGKVIATANIKLE